MSCCGKRSVQLPSVLFCMLLEEVAKSSQDATDDPKSELTDTRRASSQNNFGCTGENTGAHVERPRREGEGDGVRDA
eukprot:CAMPEP_0170314868 /NCGR_PEP_ID=MMETSP0116_2-20130129/58020_1 /TAXON_ID=400756 /ORGANISM="Durinskia baltica, Strain CSIRO CS-38" /LENGTH=76 /DNA_ID=CAMNT_0010567343 /DNA_START=296 /DNA_END=522 /DNA_ORIENTATION=+